MFRSQHSFFANILCPGLVQNKSCSLPHCIFSHNIKPNLKKRDIDALDLTEPQHPDKKINTGSNPIKDTEEIKPVKRKEFETSRAVMADVKVPNVRDAIPTPASGSITAVPSRQSPKTTEPVARNSMLNDVKRPPLVLTKPASTRSSTPVNPAKPPVPTSSPSPSNSLSSNSPVPQASKQSASSSTVSRKSKPVPVAERTDAISLTPLPVTPYAPAPHQQRIGFLKVILQELESKNVRFPKRVAMKLEYNIAKTSSKLLYPKNIRILVTDIKNGRFSKAGQQKEEENKKAQEEKLKEQLRNGIKDLLIPRDLLESHEYVVGIVLPKPVDSDFVTTCERCGLNFKPSSKNSQSTCFYHWARLPYDSIAKKRSNIYPCCSQPAFESTGCTKSPKHVYKLSEAQHMASIIPFAFTPIESTPKTLFAAGIDCEMGYTKFGVELIRVTVVDWDTGKTVLDRTVFPYGEVIDLNTRFSGVKSLDDGVTLDDIHYPTMSFKQAREALFEYISAETIIVGHGLENDLNALRLLHTKVVDTAIRYPTLNEKRKHSLKSLAHTYLGRTIQTGEHDSAEDALAAIDIVKANIKKTLSLV